MEKQFFLDKAAFVLEEAKRQGATDCDVVVGASNGISCNVEAGKPVRLKSPNNQGLTVRIFNGNKHVPAETADLTKDTLVRTIAEAIAIAKEVDADNYVTIPEAEFTSGDVPNLDLFDDKVAGMSADDTIKLAKAAEQAAQDVDGRIIRKGTWSGRATTGLTIYGNSRGILKSYDETAVVLSGAAIAKEGDTMRRSGYGEAKRYLSDLPAAETIGKKAAEHVLRQLGARKVPSQKDVKVVFSAEAASEILGYFIGAASGTHIFRESSFLRSEEGKNVAAPSVTIVDNALLPRGLGSAPFTSEGLKTGVRTIVENGVLKCVFMGNESALRLGRKPNGGGPTNVSLAKGTQSLEQIIASVDNGLYLLETSGQDPDAISGDWSMGATGIWIKDGKLDFPVSEITVAGNLLEMFRNIEAIGNDPADDTKSSPTLLIPGITIGGT